MLLLNEPHLPGRRLGAIPAVPPLENAAPCTWKLVLTLTSEDIAACYIYRFSTLE
jgi:hypothetical protein